jgi:hypothetical protein
MVIFTYMCNYRRCMLWDNSRHRSGILCGTAESTNVEAQKCLILKTSLYAPLAVRAE